jgi:hypothetical protein
MINVGMTIREMVSIASNPSCNGDLYDRIIKALELATGNEKLLVACNGAQYDGQYWDHKIAAIKSIRLSTGWGLKDAKDWTDGMVGGWKYDKWYPAPEGTKQSITLKTPEAAENLLRDLVGLGCEGFLS